MPTLHTCTDMLLRIEERHNNPTALNKNVNGKWIATSSIEMLNTIRNITLSLHHLGIKKGQTVGILALSGPEWTMADIAIMLAGGISVPLFVNIADENFSYEVKEANVKILFIGGDEAFEIFKKHDDLFDFAINIDDTPRSHPKIKQWIDLVLSGADIHISRPTLYKDLRASIKPDDLAAIIYTSGSTGTPKGVALTYENVMCEIDFSSFHWKAREDRYLSILPLAHVFGHGINLWMLYWGVSIYYNNDYKNLGAICQDVKPTAMVVVPRLLEKVYAKILDNIHHSHGLKGIIGQWAVDLAEHEQHSWLEKLMLPFADVLVFSKFRKSLGGCVRAIICGGAPLSPHLQMFFKNVGINIYEGWGLTEACPVCVNYPGKNKIGSVGQALPGQQISISPQQEVLVKGPLVMKGYLYQPKETAKAIDSEGWLHTGDRGSIDENGFLTILGRMKELYKTSTGEYVAPVPIEQSLCRYPLIDMAMVIAEGRKFASCLLFPNVETLQRIKTKQNAGQAKDEDFLKSRYIQNEIDRLINAINGHLNHWEQIHAYRFILTPLTIEGGELTPSMKIRREIVAKKYNSLIESIYEANNSK